MPFRRSPAFRRACWVIPFLFALSPAGAQELVSIEPSRVEEGRPVRVRVVVRNGGEDPVALAHFLVRLGSAVAAVDGAVVTATPLRTIAREVVTLDLEVNEDLGPIARAPRPPVRAGLTGEPHRLLRTVPPGGDVALELDWIPSIEEQGLRVEWESHVIAEAGALECYARAGADEWSPAFGADEEAGPMGMPRTVFHVRLVRWAPMGADLPPEVLIAEESLVKLTRLAQNLEVKRVGSEIRAHGKPVLEIAPAPFGLAAARARIGDLAPTAAVRLADGRWILEVADHGWWIVAQDGQPVAAPGRVFPLALALARDGRASVLWYGAGDLPELASALQQAGFAGAPGKGLAVEVTAERLGEFAALLAKNGARLDGGDIVAVK